ncbi:hypothetical protein Pla110_41680 [Polystyrenella longa]|uniref:LPS-assembly protein LptD n=2 Tax=Polystyrenella longa TaxID=2528007 RepID=A0A518CT58_9PLAN|nr:hypothetical protein Pla110_41680 [Polystyrenella longa]
MPSLRAAETSETELVRAPITIASRFSQQWTEQNQLIQILRGNCVIQQGATTLRSQQAVVWQRSEQSGDEVTHYLTIFLKDDVEVEEPSRSLREPSLVRQMRTLSDVSIDIGKTINEPAPEDPLLKQAIQQAQGVRRSNLQPTQFVVQNPETDLSWQGVTIPSTGLKKHITIEGRSTIQPSISSIESHDTTPPETVTIATGGITVRVFDAEEFGIVDLTADRMVIWVKSDGTGRPLSSQEFDGNAPLQIYMEGNIIIRQGRDTLTATHAYYDITDDRGLLLNAELRAYVDELQGDVRIRAQQLRQKSRESYHAQNAWATTSQFGEPGYRLRSTDIFLDYRYNQNWLGQGNYDIDPATGMAIPKATPWVTSLNNTLTISEYDIPVLYSPYLSGPAEDPNIPIRSVTFEQDSIFGTQVKTEWDMFKLSGINKPDGVEWGLLADYLSDRGPAVGMSTDYSGEDLFGIPGIYNGEGLGIFIYDEGEDNLGRDRRSLEPKQDERGRAQWRHWQRLEPFDALVIGEFGYLSDRNYLEQYYEKEFDRRKDVETLIYGKQDYENWSWSLLTRPQVNNFENTTEWLPKLDLYGLGEPILGEWLTWSSHSSIGYANLQPADPPTDPNDLFTPIPYITDDSGMVMMTRHKLEAPFNLGPVNVVPYVMGEAAYWDDGINNDQIDRFVGQGGIRSSLMFSRIFPNIYSDIFNLNGLAHKIRLESEYAYTDASRSLNDIPQYNEIDDNAQERFRQRLLTNTFGGVLPAPFDPRFYGVRTGAGTDLTAPYHELVEDQQVLRLALRQRLQTKVGPPERQRIRDWMRLDMGVSYFPDQDRDNFGEDFGLYTGSYQWNVGERTSILADALYDTFDDGQELWSLGVLSQRSTRGSVYAGIRQVKGGDLDSNILTASYSYVMSPKWISTMGTAYDIAEDQNRGQTLTVTRVGADFLVHFGFGADASKDNVSFGLSIEPKIGPFNAYSSQLSSLLNVR